MCLSLSFSYQQASLGLQNDACKQLWQIWDATKVKLQPLLDKHQVLEQRLDSLLVLHDINTDGSYNAIFDAGRALGLIMKGIQTLPTACWTPIHSS